MSVLLSIPAGATCRQSVKSATIDGVKATTSWTIEGSAAVFKLVSLNYTSLPAAGRNVCFELNQDAACPDLSSFCRNSAKQNQCTYAVFNQNSDCCPTSSFAIA